MIIEVVAAALLDAEGRVLIAQRPAGKSSAGRWEFPGGKREPGETLAEALQRELAEELAIEVAVPHCEPIMQYEHRQGDRVLQLSFFTVRSWNGRVEAREGQALQWVLPQSLGDCDILEADLPFIQILQGARA